MGRWLTPTERGTHVAFCYAGNMLGNMVVLVAGGYFCELTSIDGGWPLIFYTSGGFSIIVGIIFCLTVYDSPRHHPRLRKKEENCIIHSGEQTPESKLTELPLREVFSSKSVWAIFIVHLFFGFGDSILVTQLPAFFEDVLGYKIHQIGLILLAIYAAMLIMANTGPRLVNSCIIRNRLSIVAARKIATAIAMGGSAIFILVAVHLPDTLWIVTTVLLIIAVVILNMSKAGFLANCMDIAPRYSGGIFAISTTISTLPGLGSPQLVSFLTPNGKVLEWRIVFYIWAGLYLLGVLLYSLLAEGREQKWAKETYVSQGRGNRKLSKKELVKKETDEWFDRQFKASENQYR